MFKTELFWKVTGLLAISLLAPALFGFSDYSFLSKEYLLYQASQTFFYSIIYWEGNSYIFRKLKVFFPEIDQTAKRITLEFILVTAFSVSFSLIGCFYISSNLFNEPATYESVVTHLLIGCGLSYFILAIYEGADYFRRWKQAITEAEQLKREKLVSQFEALKQQISPHFLFNSLNSLIDLIPQDQGRAVEFTQHLANVYRYVLMNKDLDTVSLDYELRFIESYYFLNKIRFGEKINLEVDVDKKDLNLRVPPLSLQILIENAIKHNVVSKVHPLNIKISTDAGRVTVMNNLKTKKNTSGTKVGLQNIINRYKLLEKDAEVFVNIDESIFQVSLPTLK